MAEKKMMDESEKIVKYFSEPPFSFSFFSSRRTDHQEGKFLIFKSFCVSALDFMA